MGDSLWCVDRFDKAVQDLRGEEILVALLKE